MSTTNTPESWAIGAIGELGGDEAALMEGLGLGRKNMERFEKVKAAGKWIDENATKIAAVDDLLAALESIQQAFVHKDGDTIQQLRAKNAPFKYCNDEFAGAMNQARSAIAKAKGE